MAAGLLQACLGQRHTAGQLNEHAFGNFRGLLGAMTLNPTMGAWLNTRGNLREDPAIGRVPDENYAREVMQLFTIGLVALNLDGTVQRDGAGQPVPTYTQSDVTQLARVLTGHDWWDDGRRFPEPVTNGVRPFSEYTRRAMVFDASKHSTRAVNFLGASIPAGSDGPARLNVALDVLFNHPNVGPFFARQMIQRLVTSNPNPAYVARVAAVREDVPAEVGKRATLPGRTAHPASTGLDARVGLRVNPVRIGPAVVRSCDAPPPAFGHRHRPSPRRPSRDG